MAYTFVVEEDAVHTLLAKKSAARRSLIKLFDVLADDPYRHGHLQESDADGRIVEITLEGRFLVAYWADHAVKQVRVTRIERIRF